jgi:orotidine-5'-phosphate decarboxylase
MPDPRIILALDFPAADPVRTLVQRLRPELCALKVGKELFTAAGPALVSELVERGFRVFLDLKYHDIPNTVAQACAAATRLGVWMMNVHVSGGRAMMVAAREAIEREAPQRGIPRPMLIGVTVLTSMAAADLAEIGISAAPEQQVMRLAELACRCGLDGVVCSAREAAPLRARLGAAFRLVTPGIRLEGGATHDQTRIATPESALRDGADFLVIGRAITQDPDPLGMLQAINDRINKLTKETL